MRTAVLEDISLDGGTMVKTNDCFAIFTHYGRRNGITEDQANMLQEKYKERVEIKIETGQITYKLKER
jgi:hypothetical protein